MTAIHYIAPVAGMLLLAFLCRREWLRANRRRLAARLLAAVIAVVSLVYLILPVPLHTTPTVRPQNGVTSPADTPAGITAIYWPRQLRAGSTLQVQGTFNNKGAAPVNLLLSGFNKLPDTVTILPRQQQTFTLSARPRHIGRAVYQLAAIAEDTIEKELIPVEVLPVLPLKVLVLAAAPDFENKFLATWLSANGYAVAMRTAISKNKYSYAYLDTTRFPLEHITPALLKGFDITLADAGALAALNAAELAAIRTTVAGNGMGLLVRTDSGAARNFYNQPFPVITAANKSRQLVNLQLPDGVTAALHMEAPLYMSNIPGTQVLIKDAQQHVFVSSSLYGSGKLVCTTLQNTYSWLLSGNRDAYAALWSLLLQKAARAKSTKIQWHIGTQLPILRQPVTLYLQTSEPRPVAAVNGIPISLAQDAALPFRWQGTYWPTQAGWQAAVAVPGDTCWWYAFDDTAWPAAVQKEAVHSIEAAAAKATGAIPEIYVAMAFMLAVIFLWVEEKLV